MTVRVAVVDPLPIFARGLVATLGDYGYVAEVPGDLLDWARQPGDLAVLLTASSDREWDLLAALLQARADAVVVAVVTDPGADTYVRAITAGAAGVLPRDAAPNAVEDAIRAALTGRSVLPTDVLRFLVAGQVDTQSARPVSDNEIRWLRELAAGTTVARLAENVGYSERMMFRLLAGLYARLGVDSRTRALMRARDEGWL